MLPNPTTIRCIYGIVNFFNLAMQNNPNIIDSLFTPVNCVLHSTRVGDLVRENRKLFLHKGVWSEFKNYAYAQLHKLSTKVAQGERAELVARAVAALRKIQAELDHVRNLL